MAINKKMQPLLKSSCMQAKPDIVKSESMEQKEEATGNEDKDKSSVKNKSLLDAPMFLRKTFHMINTCDTSIATWSKDGYTFEIKDVDTFSSKIIPQYFSHNKFSSFVRQLNFYGFRKVKADRIRKPAENDVESKYWRFRHEHFKKDRPDLLVKIRKGNQVATPDQREVDVLKSEVKMLKDQMTDMSDEIEKLTSLVYALMNKGEHANQNKTNENNFPVENGKNKKRKTFEWANPLGFPAPVSPLNLPSAPLPELGLSSNSDFVLHNESMCNSKEIKSLQTRFIAPVKACGGRMESITSINSADFDQFVVDCFSDTDDHLFADDVPVTEPVTSMGTLEKHDEEDEYQVETDLVMKLQESLRLLPKELQIIFVERLVATITNPDCFRKHVDAVSALAQVAVADIQSQHVSSIPVPTEVTPAQGSQETSEIPIPLAAATLGAFLTQYSHTMKNRNCSRFHEGPCLVPVET
eukprot:CAMPEP_0195517422 /NCGR_PEP_ID=MMETSP0794_2-20130614/10773_1 /TAXON_ID=515487 /ORGANISM="Stephanopyxis turris, Strain CCMP 815" /LENGTH=467 /DNA_ID=CAMNT_0040646233 /DNA_START=22 /DNA_END=1425 /DNA_ORIENTATION=+